MSIIGDLIFLLRGDPKQLNVDVKKAGDTAGDTFGKRMAAGFKKSWGGQNIGKGLVQGLGLAGGLGAVTLISGAIGKMADVLGDATKAAIADEESVSRLAASIKANVPNWDGNTAAIERHIAAKQRLGFEDEVLRDSMAVLVGATHDVAKAQDIMGVAMDLARFKGIDLKTASEALIKVEGGAYRSLKQLGIKLKENATSTEALAAVQAVASGQAEAYAKTNAGKLLASQIKVDEAMERFGAITMPIVVEVTVAAADAASDFVDELSGVGEAAAKNEGPLENLANLLHDMFKSPEEEARTFTGTVFDALNGLQSNLGDFAVSINDFWTFWDDHSSRADREAAKMADHTRDSIESLKGAAVSDLGAVSHAIDGVSDASYDMAGNILEDNKTAKDAWEDLKKSLVADANEIIGDAYDPTITKDRLRATQAEITAQRVILASATATAAEKRDARDKLHTLEKDNSEYLLALAEAGQTGSKAYAAGIKELKESIKNAKGPARAALQAVLDKIREVEREGKNVPINIAVNVGAGLGSALKNLFKAEGGPLQAGVPYVVGERGPEIHVPAVSGTLLTTAQSMAAVSGGSSGGGGDTYQVSLLDRMEVRTPRDISDGLKMLERRGYTGRRKGRR